MEQVKPLVSLMGSKGLALLRTSKHALKILVEKHRTKLIIAASIGVGAFAYISKESPKIEGNPQEKKESTKKRPAVDKVFLQRLKALLKIMIPSLKSTESFFLLFLTVLLLARTFLSIKVAEVMGFNAQSLVEMNLRKFIQGVLSLGAIAIPASVVNSLLKYVTNILAIRFRKKLSLRIHEEYMQGSTYYKTSLGNAIDNPDQRITQDIEQFCSNISTLYTTTFKPIVDIILFTRRLSNAVGFQGPAIMYLYYALSGVFLRRLLPNFARMTSVQQQLEGTFRYHHSRLLMHSEEIAFYRGWDREKVLINQSFDKLYTHCSTLHWKQALVGVFDAWLVKYGATMVGYAVVALPVFGDVATADAMDKSASSITKGYIRNTQILINLAQATGQIVLLYKRVTQLAGYTARVGELLELFNDISDDKNDLAKRIENVDYIEFNDVDISTPNKELEVIKDLNLKILPSEHTLIMGENGSGKSSIFRVLKKLWPAQSGTISRPSDEHMLFVPQRAYFPIGTLREQVIYPDEVEDMKRKGVTDEDLMKLLRDANLDYLIEREGGWDSVKDWVDVLSGGEKQRMNVCRVFYHKPQFAFLDECTSAVSVDVEGGLYKRCQAAGSTIVTISHRKQLKKYHKNLVELGDNKRCTLSKIEESQ